MALLKFPSPLQGLRLPSEMCKGRDLAHLTVVPQAIRTFRLAKSAPQIVSLHPLVAEYRFNPIHAQVATVWQF
ncbi:hypothetical protein I79_005513 [Cricetulus griseus]|uniref:Uncharacterized protein n=1 Tax=Cricetulus griseus TaxID=10029 RepID=G3H5E9_CRIGR|nr:hypothetical protein I79_005513 [Cricetulus griseus]